MKFYILSLTFLFSFLSFSQSLVDEEYFSNPLTGHLTEIRSSVKVDDGFIVAGQKITPPNVYEGVVLRVNQIGEVVWSTLTQPQQINCSIIRDVAVFDDGFVYAQGCYDITKINVLTGEIEWTTPIEDNLTNYVIDFYDYDSSRFLIRYKTTYSDVHLAFMDKSNGDTLQSVPMEEADPIFQSVVTDPYGNIYYASGNKLKKFNGDNLHQILWERRYNVDPNATNNIDEITNLYLDNQGYMFVSGYVGSGSTNLVMAKVNPMDGAPIWRSQISTNNKLMDLKDQNGYLYMTYRHKYVGGIQDSYYTSKINKTTGAEMWYSYQDMTQLHPSSVCGHHEGTKALEVDCNGNVYLTGHYDDSGYGPGTWGIMKLNAANGSKAFDLTITQDSLSCDNVGEGKNVNIVNNIPIFVGNEEVLPYESKASFVAIDPLTGNPNIRHHIEGGFQQLSYTKAIQESKDTMFVLMQKGEHATLAMRTNFGISNWEFTDATIKRSKAGCISVNDNSAYMASMRIETNNSSPTDFENVNAIVFYQLNKSTGSLLAEDSLIISGNIELIEMESDASGEAFLVYAEGLNVKLVKWDANGLSAPVTLSMVTENVESKRPLDILNNYSSTNLLYSGNQNLYSIDKSNLSISSIYQYPSTRNVYGVMHKEGSIIISGDNTTGSQFLTSIDTIAYTLNWDQNYQTGVFAGTLYDQDTIYTFGEANGQMQVQAIVAATGATGWEYLRPNLSTLEARVYGLSFSSSLERFVVHGAEIHSNGSSDLVIERIDRSGNGSSILYVEDDLSMISQAYTAAVRADSMLWVGGRINSTAFGKEGANYLIQLYDCPLINTTDVISACDSYTWIDGNTYTTSTDTASVTLINSIGCDSIVSLDLTMHYATSGTDVQYACDSIVWLDGNTYTNNNTTATWMVSSVFGCDSLITLDLTLGDVNTGVVNTSPTLTASDAGAQYQWLDCTNGYTVIPGETNQSFTATANGDYAVIITDGNCVDTSMCYTVANVGLNENELNKSITIYPNPTTQDVYVELGDMYANVKIEITTVLGKKIFSQHYQNIDEIELELTGVKGIYFITIKSEGVQKTYRVIKQ
ncbi:Por secretion system C-terminal sorting domain-containing protein [Lishizhenia tianjinensis]|uniref:Por secretion system C-terminal sorting domain-containing protein n=1 Tax=Lishizhenia tianjinensis TaxID=477690 RepID=A0A1I6Y3B3_9FLAO|nr:T9SS type A sorting domain-containing protein [Lishizhenia tianjinensis]SFT45115.1 Por secretion system C-terminal sorting domain-containing protein [Lishizhenia tianjinensis]